MRFLKALAIGLAISATASAAHAADVYDGKMTAPQGTTVSYDSPNFDGAYVGISGGWTAVDASQNLPADFFKLNSDSFADLGFDNWLFGVQIGAQKQYGSIVLGIEADFSLLNAGAKRSVVDVEDTAEPAVEHSNDINWLGTLRARAGYPIGNFMPYITGGLAVADGSNSAAFGEDKISFPDNVQVGWAAGAGVEANLGGGYVLGAEYLHVDLGDSALSKVIGNTTEEFNAETELEIVRATLKYRF